MLKGEEEAAFERKGSIFDCAFVCCGCFSEESLKCSDIFSGGIFTELSMMGSMKEKDSGDTETVDETKKKATKKESYNTRERCAFHSTHAKMERKRKYSQKATIMRPAVWKIKTWAFGGNVVSECCW